MNSKNAGFTLIELVLVIVILGILAATALPQFIDLSGNARTAAVQGVAGGLSSASAINVATRLARGLSPDTADTMTPATVVVDNCTGAAATLQGGLPASYTITSATIANGVTATCTLTGPNGVTATFTATGT